MQKAIVKLHRYGGTREGVQTFSISGGGLTSRNTQPSCFNSPAALALMLLTLPSRICTGNGRLSVCYDSQFSPC